MFVPDRKSLNTTMPRHFATPLATDRLILRRLEPSDAAAIQRYRALPDVARYQSWENYTLADAAAMIATMTGAEPGVAGTWFQLAIVEPSGCAMVGDCGLHCLGDDDRLMELGITLAPEFQGQGYAAEALTAVISFIFVQLGKHRIHAVTDAANGPAISLFQRLGFRQEAHFVEHLWFKGAWSSECVFALLQSEWLSRVSAQQ